MPHIFISHSSQDFAAADALRRELEDGCGLTCWMDSEIAIGDSIIGKINAGLEMSELVVLWATRVAIESRWVETEWVAALTDLIDGRNRLVVIKAEPGIELPAMLKPLKYVDATRTPLHSVARSLFERVMYGYVDRPSRLLRLTKPGFPANCKAFWDDRRFCAELDRTRSGITGGNHPLDYEYEFSGVTSAQTGARIRLEVWVEGTPNKLWSGSGGEVGADGLWAARCYLRYGSSQRTDLIFTCFPPIVDSTDSPLCKRVYRIE